MFDLHVCPEICCSSVNALLWHLKAWQELKLGPQYLNSLLFNAWTLWWPMVCGIIRTPSWYRRVRTELSLITWLPFVCFWSAITKWRLFTNRRSFDILNYIERSDHGSTTSNWILSRGLPFKRTFSLPCVIRWILSLKKESFSKYGSMKDNLKRAWSKVRKNSNHRRLKDEKAQLPIVPEGFRDIEALWILWSNEIWWATVAVLIEHTKYPAVRTSIIQYQKYR